MVWCSVESVRVRVREVGWGGEGRGGVCLFIWFVVEYRYMFIYRVCMYKVCMYVCISFRGTYAILFRMILFFLYVILSIAPGMVSKYVM